MNMVLIPGGEVVIGSTLDEVDRCVHEWIDGLVEAAYRSVFRSWILKEYPAHAVTVRPFYMARYPVTNGEYRVYLSEQWARAPESIERRLPDDHPVWGVRLDEALGYIEWRRRRDRMAFRLPTEPEWELSAAGTERRRYPYGDTFDPRLCNTVESGRWTTTPVDAHPEGASEYGVFDLGGNVEEWTSSRYAAYPGGSFIDDDLTHLVGRDYPILRGGSFALGGDLARSARRHGPHPGPRFRITGFRLACDEHQPFRWEGRTQ